MAGRTARLLHAPCPNHYLGRYKFRCIALRRKGVLNGGMSKTILVADDSATMRLMVRQLLEGRYSEVAVHEAIDGVDAIEETLGPDLILMDFSMPRLNGLEAAAAIKKAMADTPIIMFTVHADALVPLCAAIGVDVISKPEGIPRLLERVDALFPPTITAKAAQAG